MSQFTFDLATRLLLIASGTIVVWLLPKVLKKIKLDTETYELTVRLSKVLLILYIAVVIAVAPVAAVGSLLLNAR
ncbi:hypothetical protein JNJ66_03135 [Candidatus Saccharibacteria bacterium]|nr:hypothetical protein [Candidatus Saccharibacteria bacterium]